MVEKKTSSEYGLPMSAENHDNPLAFLGQAVLVANLQKAKTSNCGGGKVDCIISPHSLAIWQEVPLAQLQEIRPLNRSVDRLKATLEDTGVTDALQNQQEAPPSRASLMPTQSPAVITWQANAT